jgi:SAM-dependent methyltransferase
MTLSLTQSISLEPTVCAICDTPDNCVEVYPANFGTEAFNPQTFSARRLPDRIHYRLVRCRTCGLLRSDPVADAETLSRLYAHSAQTYDRELANLRLTYGRYLARLAQHNPTKGAFLEVGCGNGFMLEEALDQGYAQVRGVEPSAQAVEKANPRVRAQIVCDIFRPGLFAAETFDAVGLFQVFDHLPDPNAALSECYRILKPDGLVLGLNHNTAALSARVLGERSPIVDIEHTYLYNPPTMARIFQKHGFQVVESGPVYNHYSLQYLAQLVPLPGGLKRAALDLFKTTGLGRLRFSLPLGNLYQIARKPAEGV